MDYEGPGMEPAVLVTGLIPALTHIDAVGFHDIATTLAVVGPNIIRNWAVVIRNARIAVAVTTWPDELLPTADRFTDAAEKLVAILEERDTTAVIEPAKELHNAYRALSDAGWAHLSHAAGISLGSSLHQGGL